MSSNLLNKNELEFREDLLSSKKFRKEAIYGIHSFFKCRPRGLLNRKA